MNRKEFFRPIKKIHKLFIDILYNIVVYFTDHFKKFRNNFQSSLLKLKEKLDQESTETYFMLSTYRKFTKGEASKEELDAANEQFKDVLRAIGLGFFAVLPMAPVTIPLLLKLGKKMDIELLPSAFVKEIENEDDDQIETQNK